MTTPPPSPFRYFQDPHHFSSYQDDGEMCSYCGLVGPGYGGGSYWEADPDDYVEYQDFICGVCLVDGKLTAKGLPVEDGERLRRDISLRRPELSNAEVEMLARQRTSEVEQRTPRIKGWPLYHWMTHCGDFCCYIKEVGQLNIQRLAPDGDGRAFLDSLLGGDVWGDVRPDAPEDSSVQHHVGIYLFQCLECGKYRVGIRYGV